MKHRKLMAGSIALMLVLGLTACGNDNKTDNSTATATEAPAAATTEAAATETTEKETTEVSEATVSTEVTEAPAEAAENTSANKAPDFTATLADGSEFKLSDAAGKPVLLNFWATWCGPCVGEMPAFEKLYKEYGDTVQIIAVDCMEDTATVDAFIEQNGYTFPIAYDVDGSIERHYPTDGIPYTLVIDQDGNVVKTFLGARGADVQYTEYKTALDEVLAK